MARLAVTRRAEPLCASDERPRLHAERFNLFEQLAGWHALRHFDEPFANREARVPSHQRLVLQRQFSSKPLSKRE